MATTDELGRRQTMFREVNENIASLTDLLAETGHQLFICRDIAQTDRPRHT